MEPRRALIIGIAGRDSSLLAEHPLAEGDEVAGVVRRPASATFENLRGIRGDLELVHADVLDGLVDADLARVRTGLGLTESLSDR